MLAEMAVKAKGPAVARIGEINGWREACEGEEAVVRRPIITTHWRDLTPSEEGDMADVIEDFNRQARNPMVQETATLGAHPATLQKGLCTQCAYTCKCICSCIRYL